MKFGHIWTCCNLFFNDLQPWCDNIHFTRHLTRDCDGLGQENQEEEAKTDVVSEAFRTEFFFNVFLKGFCQLVSAFVRGIPQISSELI